MNSRSLSALVTLFLLAGLTSCASDRNAVSEAPEANSTLHAEEAVELDAAALFKAQRWPEAVVAYTDVVAKNPGDALGWHHLGYSLHMLGRWDEALVAHERAATFPSTKQQGLYNVACIHSLQGRLDPAYDALDRAIAAGFRDARLLQEDPDMANLRADARFADRIRGIGGRPRDAAFDFWLGEWDVFDPKGVRVGRNSIALAERGFVVLENWVAAAGSTGRSLNFVDPADGAWKQVWVDDRGTVTRYSGRFEAGSMRLVGTRSTITGSTSPTRCTFTPMPDGNVRQVIEDHDAQGAFVVTFDGTYKRRDAAQGGG